MATNGKSANGANGKHAPIAAGADGAGGADDPDSEELTFEPFDRGEAPCPDAPAHVLELVASCQRMVSAAVGVPLDGTSDTLPLLDHYVGGAREELDAKPELQAVIERSVGAYFGEIVRQLYGGFWRAEGDPESWRVCLSSVYLAFNPLGVAREALANDHAEGWHAHAKVEESYEPFVKARLDAFGDIDADEFFLPSSRWDALEVVVSVVKERMIHDEEAHGFFELADYDDEEA
jgi:hypothetical protein